MPGLYFEEFRVGDVIRHSLRRTVTEADNLLFSVLTHNPSPLHLDEEYMRNTEFGQRIVNSCFTLSLMTGVSVGDNDRSDGNREPGLGRRPVSQAGLSRRHTKNRNRSGTGKGKQISAGRRSGDSSPPGLQPARRTRRELSARRADEETPRRSAVIPWERGHRWDRGHPALDEDKMSSFPGSSG